MKEITIKDADGVSHSWTGLNVEFCDWRSVWWRMHIR